MSPSFVGLKQKTTHPATAASRVPPFDRPLSFLPTFSGGLESVFNGDKQRVFDVPSSSSSSTTTVGAVVAAAAAAADPARCDLFATGGRVRPGVLVLVNDVDWELW